MAVTDVSSPEDLKNDGNASMTIVHFYTEWSDECKDINKILDTLSSLPEYQSILFKKCPAESLADVSKSFEVSAVPTIIFLKKGVVFDRITGADPALLNAKLKTYLDPKSQNKDPKKIPNAVSCFVNSDIVVAFIEGGEKTESEASRELITLLQSCGCKYTRYDVSADSSIKQNVEKISGAHQFPQLFIKGTFIGSLETVKNLNSTGELIASIEAATKNLDKNLVLRLRSLVHKAHIMVFMKGEKDAPRCGFSKQLMEILKETGLPYETFDILGDEEVRQGLKVYSNWPTYPQVYVNGELIGGLDIIKSLVDDGELIPTLRGEV